MHPILFDVPMPWGEGTEVTTWWLCLLVPLLVGGVFALFARSSGEEAWAKNSLMVTGGLLVAGAYLAFAVFGVEHTFELPTSIPIYSYGVMLGTSMILGWSIVMYFGKREAYFRDPKRNEDFLANAFIVCALSALAGSRVLYMITNPDEFDSVAQFFAFRRGGLVAYGGFLGGFFAAIVWVRQMQGIALLRFSDGAAPALGLGLGLTRIGCYLYGCDFGGRLDEDAPGWLQGLGTFPHWTDGTGSPAFMYHVQEEGLDQSAAHSFPVHPTQIYESLAGFTLFAITLFVWSRRKFHGQVILTLAMAYGLWRFLIEYVRDDPGRGEAFGFSTSQLISLAILPLAGFAYYQQNEAWKKKPYRPVRLGDPEPEAPAEVKKDADDDEGDAKSITKADAKGDARSDAHADSSEARDEARTDEARTDAKDATSDATADKAPEARTSGKKKKK
jgi:phosphatidylglycerol:prolipoprotein diacylglycerol transferase